jgi:NAD(P)-dependent dehydrogenase (short-subunit alcohol dehydrogenase family)
MDKIIAVTGASRGIGKAIAEKFLGDGWEVLALVRDPASVKLNGKVRALTFDAADPNSVAQCGAQLAKEVPGLFALVNNAGIATSAPFHKTTAEDYGRVMQVNLHAPWVLTQAVMPALLNNKGRVVNIASTAALRGFRYTSAYCTSKHALLGMTRALAHEYAPKGVTVNAVCPGWTETDMLSNSVERITKTTGRPETEARDALKSMTPTGRFVTPGEVAAVVHLMVASEAAPSITGSAYVVDGGETV